MFTEEELQSVAEKCWEKCANSPLHPNGVNPHAYILGFKDAFKELNDFAKLLAISFKEWQDENLEGKAWSQYSGSDEWYNSYTGKLISTSELYDIFLSQKRK